MSEPCDILVIGGGINGAGIARDAALRGLAVTLVERGDLCGATTRWSSRLIHGGLRYLEFGELGLVHESLQERETLLRTAGHLVRPLPLLIPVYERSRRGLNTVDFGLWVYDLLSVGRSLPGHRRLDREALRETAPGLAHDGLTGGALYYDAQVSFVERLVLENALAAREAGGRVLTHTEVRRLVMDGSRVRGAEVTDRLTGATTFIEARAVINAAGPWVDQVLSGAGRSLPRFLGPTRGTHIVVPRFPGLPDLACYVEARSDGRPFFIIPWNGLVLVGTTDLRHEGDPDDARPTAGEVDYLLAETRRAFPQSDLTRDRICYAYAGVRPLPRAGLRETAAITRRHMVRPHAQARGLYSVIGGKITTYRNLAEQAVDLAVSRHDLGGAECSTARAPLPGAGADETAVLRELDTCPGVPERSRQHLLSVYGKRAPQVAALCRESPDLGAVICPWSGAIAAEVVFGFRVELARTLGDVLFRRTLAGLSPDRGEAALAASLPVARRHLGWDPARVAAEEAGVRVEQDLLAVPV